MLERLPLLVLERICHFVDDEVDDEGDTKASNGDKPPQSLGTVAAVTSSQRFCQIHVRLVDRESVEGTVRTLLEVQVEELIDGWCYTRKKQYEL
ncbi:MAG: hypothetical protein STHCBS139747_007640 [Sporothrix thermara]